MTSPPGKHTERLGDAFVDDTALMANILPETNIQKDPANQEYAYSHATNSPGL